MKDLVFDFTGLDVVGQSVHCSLARGETLWVRGPNGSGKTTLLDLVVRRLKKKSFAYVPQLSNPRIHLTLQLREVLEIYARRTIDRSALHDFGLLETRHMTLPWNTASGGERMRTLVMAALMTQPELLLLDEPFNHMDSSSRDFVRTALRRFLAEKSSRSLVIVSHEDFKLGDRPVQELHLESSRA